MDVRDEVEGWGEEDSAVYRALAEVAVPRREEQLATLLCLLPFSKDDAFRLVDLGCGEGVLEFAALTRFPTQRRWRWTGRSRCGSMPWDC